jgi:hypothetical protein
MIPEEFKEFERHTIIRKPEEWYLSFYNFFVPKKSMLYFLGDYYIKEKNNRIEASPYEKFIQDSMNLKETFLREPWRIKKIVQKFRKQGCGNWSQTYYTEEPDIKNPSSLDQFDMSLYEWFFTRMGLDTCKLTPLERINDLETIFDIKLVKVINNNIEPLIEKEYIYSETLELIRNIDSKYYKIYNDLMKN